MIDVAPPIAVPSQQVPVHTVETNYDPFAPGTLVVAAGEETRFFEARVVSISELDVTVEEESSNTHKHSRAVPRSRAWPVRAADNVELKVGESFICRTATREWKPCIARAIEAGFCVFDVLEPFFKRIEEKRLEAASVIAPSPAIRDAIRALAETIKVESAKSSRASAFEAEAKTMSPLRPPKWKPSVSAVVLARTFWGWVPAKVARVEGESIEIALDSGGKETLTGLDFVAPFPAKKQALKIGATVLFQIKGKARSAPWDWAWPYARIVSIKGDLIDVEDKDDQRHSITREDVALLEK